MGAWAQKAVFAMTLGLFSEYYPDTHETGGVGLCSQYSRT